MQRRIRRSLSWLTIALVMPGRRDARPLVGVASAGAQTSAHVAEAQNAVSSSRRTALVSAADRAAPAVVSINVRAGGATARRRIVTGDLPTVTAEKITVLKDLQLINVTPAIQAERSLRSDQGALIFRISPEVSRATGLQLGDVILAVNRNQVRSAAEVSSLLNAPPGQVIRIYVEREGQVTFTDLVFR